MKNWLGREVDLNAPRRTTGSLYSERQLRRTEEALRKEGFTDVSDSPTLHVRIFSNPATKGSATIQMDHLGCDARDNGSMFVDRNDGRPPQITGAWEYPRKAPKIKTSAAALKMSKFTKRFKRAVTSPGGGLVVGLALAVVGGILTGGALHAILIIAGGIYAWQGAIRGAARAQQEAKANHVAVAQPVLAEKPEVAQVSTAEPSLKNTHRITPIFKEVAMGLGMVVAVPALTLIFGLPALVRDVASDLSGKPRTPASKREAGPSA